jgi:uncharacterized OB-fold protein
MIDKRAELSLSIQVCPACGRIYFDDCVDCHRCGAWLKKTIVTGRGKVYSYSVVHVGPKGMAVPYLLALVDLDGSGRVLGIVEGQSKNQLSVNQSVYFARVSKNSPVFRCA